MCAPLRGWAVPGERRGATGPRPLTQGSRKLNAGCLRPLLCERLLCPSGGMALAQTSLMSLVRVADPDVCTFCPQTAEPGASSTPSPTTSEAGGLLSSATRRMSQPGRQGPGRHQGTTEPPVALGRAKCPVRLPVHTPRAAAREPTPAAPSLSAPCLSEQSQEAPGTSQ